MAKHGNNTSQLGNIENNPFLQHNNDLIANIHIDDLNYLEKDLEFYDKVSLIFLLYGDTPLKAKYGLQILLISYQSRQSHTTFIQEWVRRMESETNPNWRMVLIEALWTIKSKHVLQKLGLDLDDLHIRFCSSDNAEVNINIHPILKGLYCIVCEQLCPDEAKQLINYVSGKHVKLKVNFIDEKFVEVFLLHWLSELVITAGEWFIDSKCKRNVFCDVEEILEFLKLDKPNLADKLRRIVIRFNFTSNNVTSVERKKNFDDGIEDENGKLTKRDTSRKTSVANYSANKSVDKYHVVRETAGTVLIINQIEFYRDPVRRANQPIKALEKRYGSNKDGMALKQTFSSLGYRIVEKANLTDLEIVKEIEDVVSESAKFDSLIVCILSHGSDGVIYGSNSVPVKIKEIQDKIVSKQMLNKPKILILQSCQGEETQLAEPVVNNLIDSNKLACDGPCNGAITIPMRCDFCVAKSTISGFSSIRHIEDGSWFIQNLCTVIDEHSDSKHFLDIMTIVKRRVTELRGDNRECMVPIVEDTFTKDFYFPPKVNAEV